MRRGAHPRVESQALQESQPPLNRSLHVIAKVFPGLSSVDLAAADLRIELSSQNCVHLFECVSSYGCIDSILFEDAHELESPQRKLLIIFRHWYVVVAVLEGVFCKEGRQCSK